MFEIAITPATAETGAVLRALDWGELVARLSAERDLRRVTSRPVCEGSSFAARASAGLPTMRHEPRVNLDTLGAVKPLAAISATPKQNVAEGDQGT